FAFDAVTTNIRMDAEFNFMLIAGALFAFVGAFGKIEIWWMHVLNQPKKTWVITLMTLFALIFFMVCIGSITSSSFNPFIYFRF
ncbi:MAG TPA: hypothetical protein P5104_01780, partial [Bacteroidales bacterium]|nr:hypothetical protein [Bacteroidales bacterium]